MGDGMVLKQVVYCFRRRHFILDCHSNGVFRPRIQNEASGRGLTNESAEALGLICEHVQGQLHRGLPSHDQGPYFLDSEGRIQCKFETVPLRLVYTIRYER